MPRFRARSETRQPSPLQLNSRSLYQFSGRTAVEALDKSRYKTESGLQSQTKNINQKNPQNPTQHFMFKVRILWENRLIFFLEKAIKPFPLFYTCRFRISDKLT
jgi:hypothetical protein